MYSQGSQGSPHWMWHSWTSQGQSHCIACKQVKRLIYDCSYPAMPFQPGCMHLRYHIHERKCIYCSLQYATADACTMHASCTECSLLISPSSEANMLVWSVMTSSPSGKGEQDTHQGFTVSTKPNCVAWVLKVLWRLAKSKNCTVSPPPACLALKAVTAASTAAFAASWRRQRAYISARSCVDGHCRQPVLSR